MEKFYLIWEKKNGKYKLFSIVNSKREAKKDKKKLKKSGFKAEIEKIKFKKLE